MTHALKSAEGKEFDDPFSFFDELLAEVYEYGKRVSDNPDLKLTFALNSLVPVDNAAWMLYCVENGIGSFGELIPDKIRPALQYHHDRLACIPLMSYGVPLEGILQAVEDGFFFLKIKIGSDPDQDGDLDKMLQWDMARLSAIHDGVKDREVEYTENGCVPYYLDANGRYDGKDRLMRFLDHAETIGALDRIVLLEEPFPEQLEIDVRDIPARLTADESAHSDEHTLERIQMGYGAVALKPIAKTMSMSLKIAKTAHDHGIPCLCADLTVNPILVDWNKNVAARLAPLPGLKMGVVEANGHQNYRNWERMKSYHPSCGAPWTESENGVFSLGEDFYARSGGVLEPSSHYMSLVST